MVSQDHKWMFRSLKPMPPLLQGELDGEKFSVADVVIYLRLVEFPGEESTWMEFPGIPLLL